MKKSLWYIVLLWFTAFVAVSCEESDETFDKYANWKQRNKTYFQNVADSARTAIAQAKAQWGNQWEEHCDWRMYKSTSKDVTLVGPVEDSICVRIMQRGTGTGSPLWTDSVRVHYRGMLMPTKDIINGKDTIVQTIFAQSYYGNLNLNTAVPILSSTSKFAIGVATALQYMHSGDNWMIYVPQQLAYGSTVQGAIPAYSTLAFQFYLVAYYRPGTVIPPWQ